MAVVVMMVCMGIGGSLVSQGERERERERVIQMRETQTQRQTDRQPERQRQTETMANGHSEMDSFQIEQKNLKSGKVAVVSECPYQLMQYR